jgi:hypothetical protein
MKTSKYTDPAVQNKTQDAATDHVDDLQQKIDNPGRAKNNSNNSDAKRKGYREGNKDDSITEEHENSNDKNDKSKQASYGKRL